MIFEIDGIPISTNQSLIASGGRLVHSGAARTFKATTHLALSNQLQHQLRVNPALKDELTSYVGEPLFCQIQIYSDWLTKAGTIRKTDLANREKLGIDEIFSVLNEYSFPLDDSQIYLLMMSKHEMKDGDKERTTVYLTKLSDFNKQK